MNTVERMIYANVFSAKMAELIKDPPREVVIPGAPFDAWQDWETEQSCAAAEAACDAVERFRRIESHLQAGYGDTTVYQMYNQARAKP